MRWNVVELAENGCYAKVERGFLVVLREQQELGRVVLDELACLLLSAEQATLSKPLMVRLAETGVPIVICGNNYHPVSLTLPYSAHHQSNRILRLQMAASQPLNKRLWQQVVQQKIKNQCQALSLFEDLPGTTSVLAAMRRLAAKVRSGDPENCEAQAARLYWGALFATGFRRNADAGDFINAALNYGYTVMRAACARAIAAAGMQPALGLHHQNQNNPFCLADDLVEPYRPLVDTLVKKAVLQTKIDPDSLLQPQHKRDLVALLQADVQINNTSTPVSNAVQYMAHSLVQAYNDKKPRFSLPELLLAASGNNT